MLRRNGAASRSQRSGDIQRRPWMPETRTLLSVLLGLLCLAGSSISRAAEDDRWARWQGLADVDFGTPIADPSLQGALITAITQDQRGFIWLGTESGLARWDGYSLRYYRANSAGGRSLLSSYIQALHVDKLGRLWVGTLNGGVSRYAAEFDGFVSYATGADKGPSAPVRALEDDGAGGIWAASSQGLCHLSPERGQYDQFTHTASPDSLPNDHVGALLLAHEGRLWVGTRTGVAYLDADSRRFYPVQLPEPQNSSPVVVNALYEDTHGRVWIGTEHGAYVASADGSHVIPVPGTVTGTGSESVQSIVAGAANEIWLGTYGHGILIVDPMTLLGRFVRRDPALPGTLNDDTPWAMFHDSRGGIWIGTTRGLNLHGASQSSIVTLFGATNPGRVIQDSDVESVLASPQGILYLGLGSEGVELIDPIRGRLGMLHTARDSRGRDEPIAEVRDLVAGQAGDLFIFGRNALYHKPAQGMRAALIRLPGINVRTGAVSGGQLWIGTDADGLWTLDLHGQPGDVAIPFKNSMALSDPRISTILPTPEGRLWIGTLNGLNEVAISSGKVTQLTQTGIGEGRSWYITTLLLDRTGRLWIGSQERGLSVMTGRDPQGHATLHGISMANGLPSDSVAKLLESDDGRIWVSTDAGLAVIDPVSFKVRPLGRGDGVVIRAYWDNSGARTRDGDLVFGGDGGLTIVRPAALDPRSFPNPVTITDLRVGGRDLPIEAGSVANSAPIAVPPHEDSVTIQYSSLEYSAPERVRYGTWLEGYDTHWNETDWTRHEVTYTNLPPGNYTLHLRSSFEGGDWNTVQRDIALEVKPAWYQTLWARSAALLLVLGVAASLMRLRTIALLRRQAALEVQVTQRTAQLREQQEKVQRMAQFDSLTGLLNRRSFTDEFARLMTLHPSQAQFALLLIDVDGLKQINDTFGHNFGDQVLVEVSNRLQLALRRSDRVMRLGSDEFAILLPQVLETTEVDELCEQLLTRLRLGFALRNVAMNLSVSIGVALYPDQGATLETLYQAADRALAEAKQTGRGTWRWAASASSQSLPTDL